MPIVRNLVLLAGQDNMAGYDTATSDLASRWRAARPRTTVWTGGRWVPLRPDAGYQASGYGPEIMLANELVKELPEGNELGLIKVAENSASITDRWNPEKNGDLFDSLIEQTRAAMMSGPVRLWGMLWLQGEADSTDADRANNYAKSFRTMVQRLRAQLGAPNLTVIAGLVSPPSDTHPHVETVRAALRDCRLPDAFSFDCVDLEMRADRFHLSPRAIGKIGRRFGRKLLETTFQEELCVRQWLWNGRNYHAWYEGPEPAPDRAVVSFPYAEKGDASEKLPFGQNHFSKVGTPAVYIRFRKADWFQNYEAFDLAWAIRSGLGPRCRLVNYGVSMGGYGALLLSGALEAEKVIAIAPQYTIDPKVFPWERRWAWATNSVGKFLFDVNKHISSEAQKYIIFDGLSSDRHHVAAYQIDASWFLTNLPNASHQVMRFLIETEAISILMQDWFTTGPPMKALKKKVRQARTSSPIYLLTRAETSRRRWPEAASRALDMCEKIGGPKARIAKSRERLARSQNSEVTSVTQAMT